MATLTVHVMADPASGTGFSTPEIASIRLVSLLPVQWRCTTPEIAGGRFTVEIEIPGPSVEQPEYDAVGRAFQDTGLSGWTWVRS
ncbi:hypothetical protein ACIQGZ_27035 [Streptomyces sp. NPDC092296]|uniref:hypothetical protein n=1 Tax=Streptomyces sp. NPDC092296 TaxID=3366012 RepID=UPI0037F73F1D